MAPLAHLQSLAMDWTLVVVLVLAALGSAVLTGTAIAVYVRRRARSHLLVALALATLLARTAVAGASFTGLISQDIHHVIEHSLDVVMAALVVAAVYYARSVTDGPTGGES